MESYSDDKILEMKYYLHFQNKKFFAKYSRFLSQAVKWGWDSIPLYLESLNIKDPLKLTFGEKLMKRELDEMEHIKQEIMTLEKSEEMKGIEIELPFPMEGKFKEEFINYSKYLLKHRVVDIRDTYLIPYQFPEESFMDRVNKIPGIQAEIKLCKIPLLF